MAEEKSKSEKLLNQIIKILDEDSDDLSSSEYLNLMDSVKDHCNMNIQAWYDTHQDET